MRRALFVAAALFAVLVPTLRASAADSWLQVFGGPGVDVALGLGADGAGGLVVSGGFQRSMRLGTRALSAQGTGPASWDGFLARLDNAGRARWTRQITGPDAEFVRQVVVDGDRVLATGYAGHFPERTSRAPVTFDAGGGTLRGAGGFDAFFAVYDLVDGRYRTARILGGAGDEQAIQVVALPGGDAVVLGQFTETLEGHTAVDGRDLFVARLGPDASLRWLSALGGLGDDEPGGIVALPGGDLVIVGTFGSALTIGENQIHASGTTNGFVARLSGAHGKAMWARSVGTGEWTKGAFVAVDESGGLVVTGEFSGSLRIDATTLASQGGYDTYLAALDPDNGRTRWACRDGGEDDEHPLGLAVGDGRAVVTGAVTRVNRVDATPDRTEAFGQVLSLPGCRTVWRWTVAGPDDDWGRRAVLLGPKSAAIVGWYSGVGTRHAAGGRDAFVAVGWPPPAIQHHPPSAWWMLAIAGAAGAGGAGWALARVSERKRRNQDALSIVGQTGSKGQ